MRNVSMPMFASPQDDNGEDEEQEEDEDGGGSTHADKWLSTPRDMGTVRRKKSKGLIGIDPAQAKTLGYRGVGWRKEAATGAKSETQKKADKSDGERQRTAANVDADDTTRPPDGYPPAQPPGAPSPSSVANGSVQVRSSSPPPEESARGPGAEAGGSNDDAASPSNGAQHIAPSVLVDSSYVSDDDDEGGADGDTTIATSSSGDDSLTAETRWVSWRRSLNPYIDARLGRPRSRIGLNRHARGGDEGARKLTVPPTSTSTSVTGGPAPSVRQGERAGPVRAGDGSAGSVPALIPGTATMVTGSGGDTASGSSTPSGQRRASKPNLVWSDAQTELESRFWSRNGRPVSSVALQPPSLLPSRSASPSNANAASGRSRADSNATTASRASRASNHSHAATTPEQEQREAQRRLFVQDQLSRPTGVPAPAIHVAREMGG